MNGNLMDTNVIVRILNGDKNLIAELLKLRNLCSCNIVLGELLYGAEKSQRTEENKKKVKDFLSHYPLFPVTDTVSEIYGKLKKELQSCGNIMPENDMWIAATAISNRVTVITGDKHFEHIPNLSVIKI